RRRGWTSGRGGKRRDSRRQHERNPEDRRFHRLAYPEQIHIRPCLRAALKSHDKIPVNIPLPSWVESARSTLEGKQDA
ncbi:MAG TPA: hypothetical protein VKA31_06310, partial [Mariprofundaceae bacterium]|nr:hypothetical protein [Mariprofundaceae bacterium]